VTTRAQPPRVAVRNAGDRDQVKRAKESDRARAERERNEDAAVWGTYDGRAFTRRLLADCGVYRLSMANEQHWTAFNEGGRNIGLQLMARMHEIAPGAYALMEQEHAERESREVRVAEPTNTEESDEMEK
jgi:hypothetical protein